MSGQVDREQDLDPEPHVAEQRPFRVDSGKPAALAMCAEPSELILSSVDLAQFLRVTHQFAIRAAIVHDRAHPATVIMSEAIFAVLFGAWHFASSQPSGELALSARDMSPAARRADSFGNGLPESGSRARAKRCGTETWVRTRVGRHHASAGGGAGWRPQALQVGSIPPRVCRTPVLPRAHWHRRRNRLRKVALTATASDRSPCRSRPPLG